MVKQTKISKGKLILEVCEKMLHLLTVWRKHYIHINHTYTKSKNSRYLSQVNFSFIFEADESIENFNAAYYFLWLGLILECQVKRKLIVVNHVLKDNEWLCWCIF